MLEQLLNVLGAVGHTVDTPGAMLRNALAMEAPWKGMFNPEERTSGEDLLEKYGLISPNDENAWELRDFAGPAAEMVLDPLNLILPGASSWAKQAARFAGPRFRGGQEIVERLAQNLGDPDMMRQARAILDSPNANQILGELPADSKLLGGGAEALGFGTPAGDVLRIGPATPPRPDVDTMLQPTRDLLAGTHRVERVPRVNVLDSMGLEEDAARAIQRDLSERTARQAPAPSATAGVVDPGGNLPQTGYRPTSPIPDDKVKFDMPLNQRDQNIANFMKLEPRSGSPGWFGKAKHHSQPFVPYDPQQNPIIGNRDLSGFKEIDGHMGNIGQLPSGEWTYFDPGVVDSPLMRPAAEKLQPATAQSLMQHMPGYKGWVRNQIGLEATGAPLYKRLANQVSDPLSLSLMGAQGARPLKNF